MCRDQRNPTGAATLTGVCVGTPGYMSPEQILASKGVDHRADLWSLGVLAFIGAGLLVRYVPRYAPHPPRARQLRAR